MQQVSEKVPVEAEMKASLNPSDTYKIPLAKSGPKLERSSSTLALKSTKKNSRMILEQSLKLLVKQQVLNLSQRKRAKAASTDKIKKDSLAESERGGVAISSSHEGTSQMYPEVSVIKLQKVPEMEKPKSKVGQESKNKNKSQDLLAYSIVLVEMPERRRVGGQQRNKPTLLSARQHVNKEIVKINPALSTEPDVRISERKSRTGGIINEGEMNESLSKSPGFGSKNSLARSPYLNSVTIKSGKFQQNRANALSLYNSNKSIQEDIKLPRIGSDVHHVEPLSADRTRQKQMMRIYQNKQSNRIKTLEARLETSEEQPDNSAAEKQNKQPRPRIEFSPKDRRSLRKVAQTAQNRSQSIAISKAIKTQDPISVLEELRKETEESMPEMQPIELLQKRQKLSNHQVKVVQTQVKLKNSKEETKKKYTRLLKSSIQPILDRLHKRVDSYIANKNLNNQYLMLSERNQEDIWG